MEAYPPRFSAHRQSLNAMVITVNAEKQPLTLAILSLTIENADSIGFDIQ